MDGTLYIAQRKNILTLDEAKDAPGLYRGPGEWLTAHGEDLAQRIRPGSLICGEWLGMGKLKYPDSFGRYNMFAKARLAPCEQISGASIDESTLCYDPDEFYRAFSADGTEYAAVPDYIGTVPVIARTNEAPTTGYLDGVYAEYADRVQRPVEGIVISQKELPGRRCKYVRLKNSIATPHITAEEMKVRMEEGLKKRDRQRAGRAGMDAKRKR